MMTVFSSDVKGYRTTIELENGQRIAVRFETVQYYNSDGPALFHTADKRVVEALKKHPRYGETFRIISEPKEVPVVEAPKPADNSTPDYLAMCNPDKEIVHNNSVTSAPLAKAYIQQTLGVTVPADRKTVAEIKEYAARTHNIVFEGWH